MNIQELKLKSSEQLITQAEELGIENASTLRKQEILFAILKKVATFFKIAKRISCFLNVLAFSIPSSSACVISCSDDFNFNSWMFMI